MSTKDLRSLSSSHYCNTRIMCSANSKTQKMQSINCMVTCSSTNRKATFNPKHEVQILTKDSFTVSVSQRGFKLSSTFFPHLLPPSEPRSRSGSPWKPNFGSAIADVPMSNCNLDMAPGWRCSQLDLIELKTLPTWRHSQWYSM